MSTLIVQGSGLTPAVVSEIAAAVGGTVEIRADHGRIVAGTRLADHAIGELRGRFPFDVNRIPDGFDPAAARLLVTDMDSTLITIECVDEIADFIGIKPQVAAITEAAMRGDIDFETSLRRRITLLKGLDAAVLDRVYAERLRLNPGAERLVSQLRARGIRTALVSGGFTFFTERLRKKLGFDDTLANELEIVDGRITGHVRGSIVGAAAKAGFLERLCQEMGVAARHAIAVGDGANDLPMLRSAGLSVGYHAKPAVQAEAQVIINHSGLDAVLAFLEN
jgi:phosphoserine phosphatase